MSDETPEADDTPTVSSTPAEPGTPEPATEPLHTEDLPTAPTAPIAPPATTPVAATTPATTAAASTVADDTTTPAPFVEQRSGFFVPKWLGLVIAAVVAALVFGGIGYAIGDSSHGDSTAREVINGPGFKVVPGNRRPLPGNGPLGRPGNGNPGNGNPGNGSQNASGNGFLGVKIMDATGGAQITAVQSGSPAANGGLQAGDLITAVDGTSITSASDLVQTIQKHNSGDQIDVTYTRNGASATAKITLSGVQTNQNS